MTLKKQFHPRNKHNQGYDFTALCSVLPKLESYLTTTPKGTISIDFSNAEAVKTLNHALLKQYYKIDCWDIPDGFLCPPIPGRVDYLHYLADLLKQSNFNKPAPGTKVRVLDIGMGASCIYPILGQRSYQWQFVASDIDPISIANANTLIQQNAGLSESIECRLQTNAEHIYQNIIAEDEYFDLTLCNPPFHESLEQGQQGSQRKWQNLQKSKSSSSKTLSIEPKTSENSSTKDDNKSVDTQHQAPLNFGGQKAELWCVGGELAFVSKMIKESRRFQKQVLWFSCLISKKDNLKNIKFALKKAKVNDFKVVQMEQGNKITRFIAWTYLDLKQQQAWCQTHFNSKP